MRAAHAHRSSNLLCAGTEGCLVTEEVAGWQDQVKAMHRLAWCLVHCHDLSRPAQDLFQPHAGLGQGDLSSRISSSVHCLLDFLDLGDWKFSWDSEPCSEEGVTGVLQACPQPPATRSEVNWMFGGNGFPCLSRTF